LRLSVKYLAKSGQSDFRWVRLKCN